MNAITTSWVEERGISEEEMGNLHKESLIDDIFRLSLEIERAKKEFQEFIYSNPILGDPKNNYSLHKLLENQISELRELVYLKAQELCR